MAQNNQPKTLEETLSLNKQLRDIKLFLGGYGIKLDLNKGVLMFEWHRDVNLKRAVEDYFNWPSEYLPLESALAVELACFEEIAGEQIDETALNKLNKFLQVQVTRNQIKNMSRLL